MKQLITIRKQLFGRNHSRLTANFKSKEQFEQYASKLMNKMEKEDEQKEESKKLKESLNDKHQTHSQPIKPVKGKSIVDKKMSIKEQINIQDNKKGKKHFIIDSEDSVNWFINKHVAPAHSTKSYQDFRREKDQLLREENLPEDPFEQLEFFTRQAKIGIKRIEEEEQLNPQYGLDEGETLILGRNELSQLGLVNQTLLEKLERDNLNADVSQLTPEEQQLFKFRSEKEQIDQVLEEMRDQGDVSQEMLKLLEDALNASELEEILTDKNDFSDYEVPINKASSEKIEKRNSIEKLVNGEEYQSLAELIKQINGGKQSKAIQNDTEEEQKVSEEKGQSRSDKKKLKNQGKAAEANQVEQKQSDLTQVQEQSSETSLTQKQMHEAQELTRQAQNKEQLYRIYATSDQKLNEHIFGYIMLKPLDFTLPEIYQLFKYKKPYSKKDVYKHQFEKLQVLLSSYNTEDFNKIAHHKLNVDQNLAFLQNFNFVAGSARKEKVIQCLHNLSQRKRDIKIFEERNEIMTAVKLLALSPALLDSLQEKSYVSTFITAVSQMKIENQEVWSSLTSYVLQILPVFDMRSLSNIAYAYHSISMGKPIMLNFDDVFQEMELSIIKKLDQILPDSQLSDPKGIAMILTSYSKTQNGSDQFYKALEKHIIACKDKFTAFDLSNIVYSISKSPNANKDILADLESTVKSLLPKAKPIDMTNMLAAYATSGKITPTLLKHFELEFKAKFEEMNAEDISKYYYYFTFLDFAGEGTFYAYLQKSLTKLIKTFDGPHLRYMFYKFDCEDRTRLNIGVRGRLTDRVSDLIKEDKIKGYDLNEIYNHTKNLKPNREDKKQHDFNYKCQLHLEKIRYYVQ